MSLYGELKSALRFSAALFICIAAVFVVGLGNIEASAAAGDTFVVGGVEYTINDDSTTVYISGYDDTLPSDVVIPSRVSDGTNNYVVIFIADDAFSACSSITSVKIPDSVAAIGFSSFKSCTSLSALTIGNNVTTIGNNAFNGCTNLKSVIIPDSVTAIGISSFQSCSSLSTLTIGNKVESVGNSAFQGCSSLESVTIPDSVTVIGISSFQSCSKLSNLIIGNNVESIGNYAFKGCSSLESVTIPDSVTIIGISAFYNCSELSSAVIGKCVTSIGNSAFRKCSKLKNINLPDTITEIGESAFQFCESLESVTIPKGVTKLNNELFSCCYNLKSVTLHDDIDSIDGTVFGHTAISSIDLPSKITGLGTAFWGCENLESIEIPEGVIYLSGTFRSCKNLKSITLPSTLQLVGNHTFSGTGIKTLILPEKVDRICKNAFSSTSIRNLIILSKSVYIENDGLLTNYETVYYGYTNDIKNHAEETNRKFVNLGALPLTVPENVTVSINGTEYADGDTVAYADVLTITANPAEGYALKTLTVNGTQINSGDTYTVDIVDSVVITAEFEETGEDDPVVETTYTVTIPDNVTVTLNDIALASGDTVLKGNVLTITAVPPQYTTLKTLTVNGVDFTSGDTFTVGEENVVITAEFDDYVENPDTGKEDPNTIYVKKGETYTATSKDNGKNFVVNGGELTLGSGSYGDVTVNDGTALSGSGDIANVTVNGGTFISGGRINDNVLVTGSSGLLGLGVGGIYEARNGTEILGNLTIEKRGLFKMQGGTAKVQGDFTFTTKYEQNAALYSGSLWIGGNFTQENKPFEPYGEDFKVIFYRKSPKTIKYEEVVIKNLWITKEADNGTNLKKVFYFENVPNGIYQCDNNGKEATLSRYEYIIDYIDVTEWEKELAENMDKLYDSYGSVSNVYALNSEGITIDKNIQREIFRQVAAWNAIISSEYAQNNTKENNNSCAITFKDISIKKHGKECKADITFSYIDFLKPAKDFKLISLDKIADGMSLDGINYKIKIKGVDEADVCGQYSLTASTDQSKFAKAVVDTINEGVRSDIEAVFKKLGAPASKIKSMSTNQFIQLIFDVYDGYTKVKGTVNKYKSQVGLFTPIYIAKYELDQNCPVDTYVYDENNVLIASIVNNEVVLDDENVVVWVDGESKHIRFNNNKYTVKTVGNDSGTMDYTLRIRDDYFNTMKSAEYYNLPVALDKEYVYETGDVNKSELIDANGAVVVPDVAAEEEKTATNGHTLTYIPYKAPAVMQSGNVEYWHCEDCGVNFLDEVGYLEASNVIISAIYPSSTSPSYIPAVTTATTTTTSVTTTSEESSGSTESQTQKEIETDVTVTEETENDSTEMEEDTEVDEDTDTTKPVDENDDKSETTNEKDNASEVDGTVSDESDENPMTSATLNFSIVIISAVAVGITRKKNK